MRFFITWDAVVAYEIKTVIFRVKSARPKLKLMAMAFYGSSTSSFFMTVALFECFEGVLDLYKHTYVDIWVCHWGRSFILLSAQ